MNRAPEQRMGPKGLFRSVAVQAAAGSEIGEPLVAYWRGVKIFTVIALVLVLVLLVFLSTVEYAKVHRVRAYVDSRAGLVRIAAPADGRVAQLPVHEGDQVAPGAVLAVLTSDRLGGNGSAYRATLMQRLQDEKSALERETSAARQEAAAQDTLIAQRLTGLQQERKYMQDDIRATEQLLLSLNQQADRLDALAAAGFVARPQIDQKRNELATQESRLATSRGQLVRVERDILAVDAEHRVVNAKLQSAIEARRRAATEVERLILQSTQEAEQTIRAGQAGTVSTALIASGQSVVAGQALQTLTPSGDTLVVRLLVPARSAAATRAGGTVKLIFQAYPQERFGSFDATIESVSSTPLLPSDSAGMYTPATEPMFIAVAGVERTLRSPDGEALVLKPGMLADALIPLEKRSIIAWMFEPILRGYNASAGGAQRATGGGQ